MNNVYLLHKFPSWKNFLNPVPSSLHDISSCATFNMNEWKVNIYIKKSFHTSSQRLAISSCFARKSSMCSSNTSAPNNKIVSYDFHHTYPWEVFFHSDPTSAFDHYDWIWIPPQTGFVKINTNGAWNESTMTAGFSVGIRNFDGSLCGGTSISFWCCSTLISKAEAALRGVSLASSKGLQERGSWIILSCLDWGS